MDILSSSSINNLITNYKSSEVQKRLVPIKDKKTKFSDLSTSLGKVSTKVSSLITLLNDFKSTSSSSIFNTKTASTSNSDFLTASTTTSAAIGAYDIFVNQLAKNDLVLSQDLSTTAAAGLTSGTYSFTIGTGDGSGSGYTSNINVDLDGTETNEELNKKIADAVNSDLVQVDSSTKVATNAYSGGSSTIDFDVDGTTYSVSVNGGGTYEDLVDELVQNINADVSGVSAEKVLDSNTGNVSLSLSVSDPSKYLSISNNSGFDLVSDLNIGVTKEKGASGAVTASYFSPGSNTTQLSFTSKESGLDYRITNLSDTSGGILSQIGLNLGSSRRSFDQSSNPDTAGFVYADITDANNQLNSKFSFNGIDIQKSSNSVDDLVSGVTFNLKSVMTSGDPNVSVNVNVDKDSIKSKFQDFISKFNDLYSYLKDQTHSTDGDRGTLIGEATASSLLNTLSTVGYNGYGDTADEFQYLSQIGITFNSDTGLSISDSTLFEEKVTTKTDEVQKLFNGTNGVATTLYDTIHNFVGSDGYIAMAQENYDSSVKYLSDRIDSVSDSIDKSADVMRKRYEALQTQYAMLLSAQSLFSASGGY